MALRAVYRVLKAGKDLNRPQAGGYSRCCVKITAAVDSSTVGHREAPVG
jgi:hypothetical protein